MDNKEIKKLVAERIKFGSIDMLSSSELLIGALDVSNSEELLRLINNYLSLKDGNISTLLSLNYNQLTRECGFTPKIASKIISIAELARRAKLSENKNIELIKNSSDVVTLFADQFKNKEHEEFWVVFLNNSNRVLERRKISDGGVNMVSVDVRLIIRQALKLLASKLILVHNHPSYDLSASDDDIQITKKIETAANLFDIKVLDHVIIAPNGEYFAF